MKNLSNTRRLTFAIYCLSLSLFLPSSAFSAPIWHGQIPLVLSNSRRVVDNLVSLSNRADSEELDLVFQGDYLSLFTSGRVIKQDKHPKSSVWNVPSRKLKEMWVKRGEDAPIIRLDPKTFRRQLLELIPDFPEVHKAVSHKHFTYKALPQGIEDLNNHIAKVIIVRQKKAGFKARR